MKIKLLLFFVSVAIFSGCSSKIGSNLQPVANSNYIESIDESPHQKIKRLKANRLKRDRGVPVYKQKRELKKTINKELRDTVLYSKKLSELEKKKRLKKEKLKRSKIKQQKIKNKSLNKDNNTTKTINKQSDINELKYF